MYRNLSKQEQRTAKTSKTCCKSNVQIRGCSLFVYPEQTSSVGISQACSRWPSFLFFPAVNIVLCQWLAITDNGCNFGRRAHGQYQTFNKHAHTYLCSASPYTESLRHVFWYFWVILYANRLLQRLLQLQISADARKEQRRPSLAPPLSICCTGTHTCCLLPGLLM